MAASSRKPPPPLPHVRGCGCIRCATKKAVIANAEAQARRRKRSAHTCHARQCDTVVPRAMLMCRRHWAMVPATLKQQVLTHYQTGQELGAVRPSVAYLKAAGDAIESVERSRQVSLFEGTP